MQDLDGTIWRLAEAFAVEDGHKVTPRIGRHPMGLVMFEDNRIVVAVADTSPAASGSERTLLSYAGTYDFDGSVLVTHAEAVSRPDMAPEQVRSIRFEGANRMVVAPVAGLPESAAGVTFVWERVA